MLRPSHNINSIKCRFGPHTQQACFKLTSSRPVMVDGSKGREPLTCCNSMGPTVMRILQSKAIVVLQMVLA